jgi:malate synthase
VVFDLRLEAFVKEEVLPGLDVDAAAFWEGFAEILLAFAARNAALLVERDRLQTLIQCRHQRSGGRVEPASEAEFLREIGYLKAPPQPFKIGTQNVDPELATIAAPQLVVPLDNARYALNAANARWGSLYDALYGTDVIPGAPKGKGYDPVRGYEVIGWSADFLDEFFPLAEGSHSQVTGYRIVAGELVSNFGGLKAADQFVGYRGPQDAPDRIVLRHHGLHVELQIDRKHPVGERSLAGVADIRLESAATAIMDFEDSVAAVDVDDKIGVYRNWLGLMTGGLTAEFMKAGVPTERRLAPDETYAAPTGGEISLKGRAVMLARNVGLLMRSELAYVDGQEVPEGVVDAVLTALIALHDVRGPCANSATGAIYVVKPKLHGPEEAAFTGELFDAVEDLLKLPRHTIKVGVMDEERRTTLNLAAVIHAVKDRVVFINTGFLDRTGDEIHTAMGLGPVLRKAEMKAAPWLAAYENQNVDVGLACGFAGRAQIGKGMWAMPDAMADMLEQKIAHPQSGATTAWVPSPTAATLHAIHYHRVDVAARQRELAGRNTATEDLLRPPVAEGKAWSAAEIQAEVEANAQAILGYVVRWVDLGVGCSKVPDVNNVGLMEDRATCRISSQLLANWLAHGVVKPDEVLSAFRRMAVVVDRQNADDEAYRPMGEALGSNLAFLAAKDLVFQGAETTGGYTEPVLHAARARVKAG